MPEQDIDRVHQWSNSKKLIILFIICYLLLYMFPFPLDHVPVIDDLVINYTEAIDFISLWFGTHILKIENLGQLSNLGDNTFLYVKVFSIAILALILATLLFFIIRSQKSFENLYNYTIKYGRYYVGLYMIIYGFMKISGGQFVFPPLRTLETSFGNLSPPQLFWAFTLGYSKVYGTFIAIGEILGGYLLIFKRTKVIGALIVVIVMCNVVLLDIAFNLSVATLFSIHLLLITFLILLPYVNKIVDFFLFNKTVSLHSKPYILNSKRVKDSSIILKSIIIVGFSLLIIYPEINSIFTKQLNPPLYGVYYTKKFIINGDSSQCFQSGYWKRIIIDRRTTYITTFSDSTSFYKSKIDTIKQSVKLISAKDTSVSYDFLYNVTSDFLTLTGTWKGNNVQIFLNKRNLKDYFLINRKPKNTSKYF